MKSRSDYVGTGKYGGKKHVIPKEVKDHGRQFFEACVKDGRPRCQAYSVTKLKVLRTRLDRGIQPTDEELADAQCGKAAEVGYRVCGSHGVGYASRGKRGGRPVEHGRYSRVLKDLRIGEIYDEVQSDGDLIRLDQEIALIISRVSELLEGWSDAPDMAEFSDALTSMGEALQHQDYDISSSEYFRLVEIFNAARGHFAIWREITALIEQQRKLVSTELSRLEKLQHFLTAEQALMLMTGIVDILRSLEIPGAQKSWAVQQIRMLAIGRPQISALVGDSLTTSEDTV